MSVFNIIFPIFSIALIGYALTYAGVFSESDLAGLNKYVFNIAIPILLFNAMSNIELPEQIEWEFVGAYFGVALFVFFIGNLIGRQVWGYQRKGQAIVGLGSSYSNMVLIGLPVISTGLGDEALLPMLLLISFHSAVMFSAVTLVAESEASESELRQAILKPFIKILRNPIIIGLIVGILFNRLGWSLPFALSETVRIIRGSTLPAALFVMGASLVKYQISGEVGKAAVLIFLKMLCQPLLVWLLLTFVFEVNPLARTVAIIAASLPIGVNAAVFANQYERAVAPVSAGVLLSTLVSMGSLSFLLSVYSS